MTTQAPRGSRPDIEPNGSDRIGELEQSFGALMASQARIEAGWRGARQEYETFARSVTQLERRMGEVLDDQKITRRTMRRIARLAPAVLAAVEVARHFLERIGP